MPEENERGRAGNRPMAVSRKVDTAENGLLSVAQTAKIRRSKVMEFRMSVLASNDAG
jgi:hypothetical protein